MVSTRSMGSNLGKRKATDELVSLPPAKRSAKKNSVWAQQPPRLKLSSPPRRAQRKPVYQVSSTSATSSRESSVSSDTNDTDAYDADIEDGDQTEDEDTDDSDAGDAEANHLLDRIRSGIAYTQQQQVLDKPIMQITYFQIDTSSPSSRKALALLGRHAVLIASAPPFELFELGIPRPNWVAEGDLPGLHDPQWWVGKSQAEIKAGPHAEEADVRKAAGHLKGLETRRSKKKGLTAREKENEWKLNAAMENQKKRAYYHDKEEDDNETDSVVDGGEYVPSC